MIQQSKMFNSLGFADNAERATLKGIKGLTVAIGVQAPELIENGLSKYQLQTDVELRLRKSGIEVLSMEEASSKPGAPFLQVLVFSYKFKQLECYYFFIVAELNQDTFLKRNPSIQAEGATTWSSPLAIGTTPTGHTSEQIRYLRDRVSDRIDEFINDYLAVNPTSPLRLY
jgi:hypothetical protein